MDYFIGQRNDEMDDHTQQKTVRTDAVACILGRCMHGCAHIHALLACPLSTDSSGAHACMPLWVARVHYERSPALVPMWTEVLMACVVAHMCGGVHAHCRSIQSPKHVLLTCAAGCMCIWGCERCFRSDTFALFSSPHFSSFRDIWAASMGSMILQAYHPCQRLLRIPMPTLPCAQVPVVRMFGVNDNGNSVCVFVHGFQPYFFCEKPRHWGNEALEELQKELNV